MSEGELVDMLHVTAMKLHIRIRSIQGWFTTGVGKSNRKTGNFQGHLANANSGLPDDCCLLPINSYGAARFRDIISRDYTGQKRKQCHYPTTSMGGTTAFS